MCLLYATIFLSYFINSFYCSHVSVSDLPPIFHIDENYEKCKEDGKLFCKVTIVLQNGNSTSPYWKLIEETIQDPRFYNHNELFQAICIEDFCPIVKDWKGEEVDFLKPYLSQCYTEKYKYLGLTAQVASLKCSRHEIEYQAGILDYSILYFVPWKKAAETVETSINCSFQQMWLHLWTTIERDEITNLFTRFSPIVEQLLIFINRTATTTNSIYGNDLTTLYLKFRINERFIFLTYSCFIIYASHLDYKIQFGGQRNGRAVSHFTHRYIIPFSAIANWQTLVKSNGRNNPQRLKCIQGIRFYNMLLIILCHTYSSYIGGYVKNTDYFEKVPESLIHLCMRNLFVFLVQTFFLFSGFLLSYHFFQLIEERENFSIRCIILTFVNRYLRIFPPVLLMLASGVTLWVVSFFHGPIKDLYSDLEYQRCRKNWWTTVFFINNHYNQHEMCYFISWYLAADTQLYVLSLLVLSFVWKYRTRVNQILSISIAIGILVPVVINYIYNLDIIYRITPENSKNNQFRSFNFSVTYSSMYANMATYMLGVSFGYIYYKVKNYRLFSSMALQICWWMLFLGLPMAVVLLSSFYYNRFFSALLCGLLKPLYALGIGIGVLGMSQNVGGLAKSICEWRIATFLGNFTYSTYLVHYGIVFYRTATAKEPMVISNYILAKSFVADAIISFTLGSLMHILVEMPALRIQKIIVPQVRAQKHHSDKSKY